MKFYRRIKSACPDKFLSFQIIMNDKCQQEKPLICVCIENEKYEYFKFTTEKEFKKAFNKAIEYLKASDT